MQHGYITGKKKYFTLGLDFSNTAETFGRWQFIGATCYVAFLWILDLKFIDLNLIPIPAGTPLHSQISTMCGRSWDSVILLDASFSFSIFDLGKQTGVADCSCLYSRVL